MSTVEYPKINEWLTQVEKEMRVTLAQHLADSVRDIRQFKEGVIDQPAFMSWCDKYVSIQTNFSSFHLTETFFNLFLFLKLDTRLKLWC